MLLKSEFKKLLCIDNRYPITLEWNGKVVGEKVYWWQYESDPTLNSNVFEVAQALVQKHFPGTGRVLLAFGLF